MEPAAGRVRAHHEDEFDILAGSLDADTPIAAAENLDTALLLNLVPLERGKDNVRVICVELALVPGHHDLFAGPPSRHGGSRGWRVGGSGIWTPNAAENSTFVRP